MKFVFMAFWKSDTVAKHCSEEWTMLITRGLRENIIVHTKQSCETGIVHWK